MLTPAFELSQDSDFLTIVIKARFARISETEVFVDGKNFKFYSKPYFLRLCLPGALVEDGRESAEYDVEKGNFTIRIPKENPGELFDGLDMLTKLMAPSGQVTASEPTIQPVASGKVSHPDEGKDEEQGEEEEDEEEINWEVEQTPCLQDEDDIIGPVKYGFAGRRSGVFSRLQDELSCIVDIPDPDKTQPDVRRKAKWMAEGAKFNDEHYLADLYQDETIKQLLSFQPPWEKLASELDTASSSSDVIKFTDEEKEKMRKLPHKEYLLDKTMEKTAYMGLVDILFGYAYNVRCSEGGDNVESAWTICKLSSTLSWLDMFSSLEDVVVCCVRRALCYPLHRHWELAMAVLKDVRTILHLGRNQVLKALLEVHSFLAQDDPRYILNELYITDYCVWIQGESRSKIKKLAEALDKVKVSKKDVNLDLDELEEAARCVLEHEDEGSGDEAAIQMIGYPQLMQQSKSGSQNVVIKNQSASESSEENGSSGSEEESEESEEEDSDEDDRDASDENSEEDERGSQAVCNVSSNNGVVEKQSQTNLREVTALAPCANLEQSSTEQKIDYQEMEKENVLLVCDGQNMRRNTSEMVNSDFKRNLSSCLEWKDVKGEEEKLESAVSQTVSRENETLPAQRNSDDDCIPPQPRTIELASNLLLQESPSQLGDGTVARKGDDKRSKNNSGTNKICFGEQPVVVHSNEQFLQQEEGDSAEVLHLSSRVASLMIETSKSQAWRDLSEQKLDSDDESDDVEGANETLEESTVK